MSTALTQGPVLRPELPTRRAACVGLQITLNPRNRIKIQKSGRRLVGGGGGAAAGPAGGGRPPDGATVQPQLPACLRAGRRLPFRLDAGRALPRRGTSPVLCQLIEEPIKQSANLVGQPLKGRVKTGTSHSTGRVPALSSRHPYLGYPVTHSRAPWTHRKLLVACQIPYL